MKMNVEELLNVEDFHRFLREKKGSKLNVGVT